MLLWRLTLCFDRSDASCGSVLRSVSCGADSSTSSTESSLLILITGTDMEEAVESRLAVFWSVSTLRDFPRESPLLFSDLDGFSLSLEVRLSRLLPRLVLAGGAGWGCAGGCGWP